MSKPLTAAELMAQIDETRLIGTGPTLGPSTNDLRRQRALLDGMRAISRLRACNIRRADPPTGIVLDAAFFALDAYLAAGGKLEGE